MEMLSIEKNCRAILIPEEGSSSESLPTECKAVTAYLIMGRSENSRNRVFVEEGEGIRTQAFDESKLTDPSLIIYAPCVYSAIRRSLQTEIRLIQFMKVWTDR